MKSQIDWKRTTQKSVSENHLFMCVVRLTLKGNNVLNYFSNSFKND